MAINIESGSTWAEIRRLLNKDSAEQWKREGDAMTGGLMLAKDPQNDMEASTKKYTDDKFLFVPGDFLKIPFGNFYNLDKSDNYWGDTLVSNNKFERYQEEWSSDCAFWNDGSVKMVFDLSRLRVTYRQDSNTRPVWNSDCRGAIHIKFSVNYEGEDDIVIYEEDGDIGADSLIFSNKSVTIDNFNVKAGEKLNFKSDIYMYAGSNGFYTPYTSAYSFSVVNGDTGVHFSMNAFIGNHILGAQSESIIIPLQQGVWSDE